MDARWMLKRGLKWGVEWAMALSGAAAIRGRSKSFKSGLRILTYHRVAKQPENSHTVSLAHFREHMAWLSGHTPLVGLKQGVGRMVQTNEPVPGVAVTFDDGFVEAAGDVAEILERYRVPAAFYVVTGQLDGEISLPGGPYLGWSGVKELYRAGFEIGSHSVRHLSLAGLPGDEMERELALSGQRMAEELGEFPAGLSYPFGTMRDFSAGIARAAKRAGYEYGLTAIHGLNRPGGDPFTLKRISMTAGDGLRTFRMIMKGCLDPWVLVDRFGAGLQRNRN